MIQKFLIILFLANLTFAQNSLLYCNLEIIDDRCTCNFVIFNPNGVNNLTITANPVDDCTLGDVVDAYGSGMTKNIPSVLCSGLPKLEKLKMEKLGVEILSGNPFRYCTSLKRLHLSGNQITSIPPYTFSNTKLEILELDDNKITNVISIAFDGLWNLEVLDLTNNLQLNLDNDTFDHLENLKFLYMSHCGIQNLIPAWFSNLPNLIGLDLSTNIIRTIQNSTFVHLPKLEVLDLSYSGVVGNPTNIFQNNTELLRLNLQNNGFMTLPLTFFANQQKLTDLNLSYNVLLAITPEVLKPLASLKNINLSSSNINQVNSNWFESMENLEIVDLSKNTITVIPDHTFKFANGIQLLNLGNNELTALDSRSFGSLKNLRNLIVNNNKITEIDHHFIIQSTNLLTVNFEYNICTNLTTEAFDLNRISYMDAMKGCFDNFDKIPINITTINSTIYDWHSIRSSDGWDALEVIVRADENVHIALTDSLDVETPTIEIQIGQNRNRRAYILEQGEIAFRDPAQYRLDTVSGSTFIIGWRFGIVMVFKKGDQFPFMAHTIRTDNFSVNFFGLRTLFEDNPNSTATWSVSRIHATSASVAMMKIYQDIEIKMKNRIPIDLRKYLRY